MKFSKLLLLLSTALLAKTSPVQSSNDNSLYQVKESCEADGGKFFSNDEDYVCLGEPRVVLKNQSIVSFFLYNLVIYNDHYYTPNKSYTKINSDEFYDSYVRLAKVLNVNVNTLVPYKSYDDAVNEYIKFRSKDCLYFYRKDFSFACLEMAYSFGVDSYEHLRNVHEVVKGNKMYSLTDSSFKCEKGDLTCYDKIAYLMDVDVNSIIPQENEETIYEIRKGCEKESGYLAYGYDYDDHICFRTYHNESDVPENSVCYLNNNKGISCINENYTDVEYCLQDNEKYNYNSCREALQHLFGSYIFSNYLPEGTESNPSSSPSSKTVPITSSKSIPSSYTYYEPPHSNDPAESYYIFIEGGDSTDKPSLLQLVNDRMNEIYEIIYKNGQSYRYFNNDDINNELDTPYPEGKKFLFVKELSEYLDSSDDYVPMTSSLIKVGNYLTGTENGCTSSSCHTIYAYLTKDMSEAVKNISNISKVNKSDAYSYIKIEDNKAPITTPPPKNSGGIEISTKKIPVITSTKAIPSTNIKTFTTTKNSGGIEISTKKIPVITSTKTIPSTNIKTFTTTKNLGGIETIRSTKTIPSSSTEAIPTTSTKAILTSTTKTIIEPTTTKIIPTNDCSNHRFCPACVHCISDCNEELRRCCPQSCQTSTSKTVPAEYLTTTLPVETVPTKVITTSSTKTIPPTSTKTIPPTSTKTIPPTSTKTIPPTSTKTIPPTSTKTIPPTSTKTIPPSTKCVPVTVTVKETITKKETVTVTIGGGPTNQPNNCAPKWAQCGGIGYSGPTCCEAGSTCKEYGTYYSQCV